MYSEEFLRDLLLRPMAFGAYNYPEKGTDMNMTALKPLMVTACVVARYFNRQESKPERVKQSVLDAELILKELGLNDPTVPVGK